MRFVCESCRAQYMISDDKVGPRGVKFRCRKCGHVVLVKRDASSKPLGVGAAGGGATRAPASQSDHAAATPHAPSSGGEEGSLGAPDATPSAPPTSVEPPVSSAAAAEGGRSSNDEGAATVVVQIPALAAISKPLGEAPDEHTDETVVASSERRGASASEETPSGQGAPAPTEAVADRGSLETTSPILGALGGSTERELPRLGLEAAERPGVLPAEEGLRAREDAPDAAPRAAVDAGHRSTGEDDSEELTHLAGPPSDVGMGAGAPSEAPPAAAATSRGWAEQAPESRPDAEPEGADEAAHRAEERAAAAATLDGVQSPSLVPAPSTPSAPPPPASPAQGTLVDAAAGAPAPRGAAPIAPRPNAADMASQLRGVGMPDASLLGAGDEHALEGLFGADDEEISAVFDQALGVGSKGSPGRAARSAQPRLEEDRESTRVLEAGVARRLVDESAPPAPSPSSVQGAGAAVEEVPQSDWYVAIDDKETGPLTLDAVKARWDRGELGPDSLCWRQGMADWVPVSEVKMLAGVLVPKPPKPIVVPAAVATASSQSALVGVSSQVAFSSGGLAQAGRVEVPVPMPGVATMAALSESDEVDAGGWRPSAASALASLVSAELDALAKPSRGEGAVVRRDDALPLGRGRSGPFEAELPVQTQGAGAYALSATQATEHARDLPRSGASGIARGPALSQAALRPVAEAPPVRPEPPVASEAYVLSPPAGPSYSSPAVTSYQPPSQRNLILAIVGAAAAVVLVLVGLVAWLATRTPASPVVVAPPPASTSGVGAPASAPPPTAAAPGSPGAAAGAVPAGGGAATSVAAAPPATAVQPATGQPPTTASEPGTAARPGAPSPGGPAASPEAPPAARVAAVERSAERAPERGEGRQRPGRRAEERAEARAEARVEARPQRDAAGRSSEPVRDGASTDDDFAKAFGGGGAGGSARAEGSSEGRRRQDVYVPPPPGGAPVKERLETSDVMEVVISQKAALVRCSAEQKKRDPGVSGKLVMQWTVLPSGKTTQVSCVTDEFKRSYFAACVGGLIKQMTFPRHRVQGEPVQFPFKF